jgi:hypothetical protein
LGAKREEEMVGGDGDEAERRKEKEMRRYRMPRTKRMMNNLRNKVTMLRGSTNLDGNVVEGGRNTRVI